LNNQNANLKNGETGKDDRTRSRESKHHEALRKLKSNFKNMKEHKTAWRKGIVTFAQNFGTCGDSRRDRKEAGDEAKLCRRSSHSNFQPRKST